VDIRKGNAFTSVQSCRSFLVSKMYGTALILVVCRYYSYHPTLYYQYQFYVKKTQIFDNILSLSFNMIMCSNRRLKWIQCLRKRVHLAKESNSDLILVWKERSDLEKAHLSLIHGIIDYGLDGFTRKELDFDKQDCCLIQGFSLKQ
jgi:hypothetical protein